MIDLVFNILNLLVFLFLITYGFYRYLLPSLKASFNEYQVNIVNLENKKDELVDAQLTVANKMVEREKLCVILNDKITVWKQSTDAVLFRKRNNYVQFKNKLYEKIKKQSENYQYEQLKKSVTPKLIESLTEKLEHYFKKEENTELYFANIFKELK